MRHGREEELGKLSLRLSKIKFIVFEIALTVLFFVWLVRFFWHELGF